MGTTTPAELGATTRAVAGWLGESVGEAQIHVAPSAADGVHVNLVAIKRAGAANSAREGAVRFRLDYLVSCVDRAEPLAALDPHSQHLSAEILGFLKGHSQWTD